MDLGELIDISGVLVLEEGTIHLKGRPYWRWGGRRNWDKTLKRKDK